MVYLQAEELRPRHVGALESLDDPRKESEVAN